MENNIKSIESRSSFSHMKDLFKMFLFRMWRDSSLYVLLGIDVVVSAIFFIVIGAISSDLNNNSGADFSYYFVWCQIMASGSIGLIMILMLGLLFSTNFFAREFNFGTIRNIFLAGKKRIELYVSVLLMTAIITLVFFLIPFVIASLTSVIFSVPLFAETTDYAKFFLGAALILLFGLSCVCFVVSITFMMGRGGPAYWIFYGSFLLIYVGFTIMNLIQGLHVPGDEAERVKYLETWTKINELIPTYQLSYFRAMCDFDNLGEASMALFGNTYSLDQMPSIITKAVLEYTLWGGLWTFLGIFTFNRKDLK
ncbi:MAG: ABC transporter permease [Bacilli bacterium]|nr:ABC transporter permease [Bacilli bacterium]